MRLKELTELNGVSGYESSVRKYLKKAIEEIGSSYKIDKLGNIIVKNEGKTPKRKLLLGAHMDEVGLIVTSITSSGFLKFHPMGGVNSDILISKVVEIGDNKIKGVIGFKPIHLLKDHERGKKKDFNELYIDIGAKSKEDAESKVNLGDYVAFKSDYVEFGSGLIKAKALDDRVGVEVLLSILEKKIDLEFYVVFTVMEELGTRGAQIVAKIVEPDLAIILEGTISADMHDVKEHEKATRLRKGPAISIMDGGSIYDVNEINNLKNIAKENDIPCQIRGSVMGATDGAAVHKAKAGCKLIGLSVPCRYIHSPVSVTSKLDIDNTKKLLFKFLEKEGGL